MNEVINALELIIMQWGDNKGLSGGGFDKVANNNILITLPLRHTLPPPTHSMISSCNNFLSTTLSNFYNIFPL